MRAIILIVISAVVASSLALAGYLKNVENQLIHSDHSKAAMVHMNAATNCWCDAGCFYGDPDSYHFKKSVNVQCSLPLARQKQMVARALMEHFVKEHGVSNVDQILNNVSIKCFTARSQ
jgi:hypothetical protein